MSNLDPEIAKEFKAETNGLLQELTGVVAKLEATEDMDAMLPLLEEYALKIDRIMGAAKTIAAMAEDHVGLKRIGGLAELCKSIGYKAAAKKNPGLIPIISGFLSDTLDVIKELLETVDDVTKAQQIVDASSQTLNSRLQLIAKYLA